MRASFRSSSGTGTVDVQLGLGRRENHIIPLYRQVEEIIRHRIATRQYNLGTQIPSENEFARELKISRVTVREALAELVRENLLVKVQGKGTFVAPELPKVIQPIKYDGFLEDLYRRVQQLKVVLVEKTLATPTDYVRNVLHLPKRVQEVVQIKRCRHIDGAPFSFTVNYLPVSIGSRIDPVVLQTVPLNTMLERDLDVPVVRAEETVEAAPANPEVAEQLGIPVLYPVMHVTRLMFTTGDHAFEVVETFYRADKYHYRINLSRVRRDGEWFWDTPTALHSAARPTSATPTAPHASSAGRSRVDAGRPRTPATPKRRPRPTPTRRGA
jgi:GntR family transcriptional regulator